MVPLLLTYENPNLQFYAKKWFRCWDLTSKKVFRGCNITSLSLTLKYGVKGGVMSLYFKKPSYDIKF
jgi:hypothetical protein